MSEPIAKELLIRWAETESTLEQYKPAVREFVYAVDTGNVFMGTNAGARKLAYWVDVKKYVSDEVQEYKPKAGTSSWILTNLKPGQIGYNKDIKRLQFLDEATNIKQTYATTSDLILKDPMSIKISDDNIDSDDDNSVTLSDFKRPMRLLFVNGTLVTDVESDDIPYYEYNKDSYTLKIYHMSDGDIISYF
jgi:hypothetical protein